MTKDSFLAILGRHLKSGLSIKKNCSNEAYYSATFYYWKSKLCSSVFDVPAASGDNSFIEDFAPVRFPAPQKPFSSSTGGDLPEIRIELP